MLMPCMQGRWVLTLHLLVASYHALLWAPEGLAACRAPPTQLSPSLVARHALAATLQQWAECGRTPSVMGAVLQGGMRVRAPMLGASDGLLPDEVAQVTAALDARLPPAAVFTAINLLADIFPTEWPFRRAGTASLIFWGCFLG